MNMIAHGEVSYNTNQGQTYFATKKKISIDNSFNMSIGLGLG